jgi:hypothetical protein
MAGARPARNGLNSSMEEGQALKEEILAHARQEVDKAIEVTRASLASVEGSLANETKSSAGDKFETGRAMLHMEIQKLNQQLTVAAERQQAIHRIIRKSATELISEGSLVATNRGLYLVGLSLGKVRLEGRVVFCTSLESPIGAALMGKQIGEMFTFNELDFVVRGVV